MVERSISGVKLQLHLLTRAIARYPNEPVNYLLRGEEFLLAGQVARAQTDFEMTIRLAEQLQPAAAWGYLHQSYVDRARLGLRACTHAHTDF